MPLKERSGKLLREFININYKVINSHGKFTCKDLENFLNKKNIYKAHIMTFDERDCGSYYSCCLAIPQGDGAPGVSYYATINKTTGYATVDWNGWEGINWTNARKYTKFYVTK